MLDLLLSLKEAAGVLAVKRWGGRDGERHGNILQIWFLNTSLALTAKLCKCKIVFILPCSIKAEKLEADVSNTVNYVFYRYRLFSGEERLDAEEQFDTLTANVAIEVAYRRLDPTDQDRDTSFIEVDRTTISPDNDDSGYTVLYFKVARHLTSRWCTGYDEVSDRTEKKQVPTDEWQACQIVCIPAINILAAADRASADYLSAKSALSRFKAIIEQINSHCFSYELAGREQDVMEALQRWSLDRFTFDFRPYNPTVQDLGQKLHELANTNRVQVAGNAKPLRRDGYIEHAEQGFIGEVLGLSSRGYGNYGFSGETEEGYKATIPKRDPSSTELKKIRIAIDQRENHEDHIKMVALCGVRLYG